MNKISLFVSILICILINSCNNGQEDIEIYKSQSIEVLSGAINSPYWGKPYDGKIGWIDKEEIAIKVTAIILKDRQNNFNNIRAFEIDNYWVSICYNDGGKKEDSLYVILHKNGELMAIMNH